MTDLNERLIAYVSGQLRDDQAAEIETVLMRYVDHTLDPADADEIDRTIGRHPEVAAMIDEAVAGKRWFEETLATELLPIISNAEASPKLQNHIETLASPPSSNVETGQKAPWILSSLLGIPASYALAASIALALLIGGLSYTSMLRERLVSAQNLQLRLEQDLERQIANQEQQLAEIASLEDRIEDYQQPLASTADLVDSKPESDALPSEPSEIEKQLAASLSELEAMTAKAEKSDHLRDALDAAKATERNAAEDHQRTIKALDREITELSAALTAAENAREIADEQRNKSELIAAALRAESVGRAENIDELREQIQDQTADLEDRERQIISLTDQIADLDAKLLEATQQIAGLTAAGQDTDLATMQNPDATMPNWITQVAGYYRLYADQPRRHLVEVKADEQQHIEKWLGEQLGRTRPHPRSVGGRHEISGSEAACHQWHACGPTDLSRRQ